jgi:DNA repair protein SbcC/Rad50
MCYGDNVPELDLEGVKLACLSGDNGHGKSALLEAMTWALWGKARAKSDDELIQLGRTEMEVEFDFELGGDRYRVIRKRAIKGSGKRVSGTPTLDFQILSQSGYHTLAGNSISETQRKIIETLRMEYETFINSSFILQNRADEFTVKAPGERKRVLADILGLGLYDELEDRARELVKKREMERRELSATLKTIDDELARRPQYERELADVQQLVEQVEEQIALADSSLRLLRELRKEFDLKTVHLVDMQKQARRME